MTNKSSKRDKALNPEFIVAYIPFDISCELATHVDNSFIAGLLDGSETLDDDQLNDPVITRLIGIIRDNEHLAAKLLNVIQLNDSECQAIICHDMAMQPKKYPGRLNNGEGSMFELYTERLRDAGHPYPTKRGTLYDNWVHFIPEERRDEAIRIREEYRKNIGNS